VLDAFPTTANGKLDRAALPAPAAAPAMDDAPRSELEAWIAATWCELLRVDRVALDQNFFAAGGHSLLLTQLGIRIERELGVTVELRSLFDAPTVRGVTAAVEAELARVERLLDEIEALSPEEAAALLAQETE
jgi:acyl carrier protein